MYGIFANIPISCTCLSYIKRNFSYSGWCELLLRMAIQPKPLSSPPPQDIQPYLQPKNKMAAPNTLRLGSLAPNFTAPTTKGEITFYDWKKESWAILFSHPEDFTPVCTTELGAAARLAPEWTKRGVKVCAFCESFACLSLLL